MTIEVKGLLRSRADDPSGVVRPDIITIQARYPRFIHAEVKTHRLLRIDDAEVEFLEEISLMDDPALSRNASSSRAIPVRKLIDEAINDPAMPVAWHYNEPGMQGTVAMSAMDEEEAKKAWERARDWAVGCAEHMRILNAHKQIINRILEPYTHISVVITATEWGNFFDLRRHPDADPTMRALADAIHDTIESMPVQILGPDEWHLPYMPLDGNKRAVTSLRCSAARCARVSYLKHDGAAPKQKDDLALAQRLLDSKHMSPFEHQAKPGRSPKKSYANLVGWESQRSRIEARFLSK